MASVATTLVTSSALAGLPPGQLVLADDYHAIVLRIAGDQAELFLSNGLRVLVPVTEIRPLGLRPGDGPDPPGSFAELVFPPASSPGAD